MCLTLIVYFCASEKRNRDAYDGNSFEFRLREKDKSKKQQQSKEVSRINEMFVQKSESQRPGGLTQCNGNDFSEIG